MIGYEGIYQIDNSGNIKAMRPRRGDGLLKLSKSYDGYIRVNLTRNKIHKKEFVHRLVALAFIPNLDSKRFINHKNGVKNDNQVENLEWCTAGENLSHAFKVLGKKHNKPSSRPVIVSESGIEIAAFPTIRAAASHYKIDERIIIRSAKGITKRPYKYKQLTWKYAI